MDSQAAAIGAQFVTQYYQMFDTDRAKLVQLYRPDSQMSFEGVTFVGSQKVYEKLSSLPFKTVQHLITTTDCHLTVDGGLLVFVVGKLKTDDDPPHGFSQTFYLKQFDNSLFVMNDVFRLIIHNV